MEIVLTSTCPYDHHANFTCVIENITGTQTHSATRCSCCYHYRQLPLARNRKIQRWFTISSPILPPRHPVLLPSKTVLFRLLPSKHITAQLKPQLQLLVTVVTSLLTPTLPRQHLEFPPIATNRPSADMARYER